jgi:hypothetical protein
MTTFKTSREIPATVEQVFAAISDSERLARWWGPAGFTNTFNVCEIFLVLPCFEGFVERSNLIFVII